MKLTKRDDRNDGRVDWRIDFRRAGATTAAPGQPRDSGARPQRAAGGAEVPRARAASSRSGGSLAAARRDAGRLQGGDILRGRRDRSSPRERTAFGNDDRVSPGRVSLTL